MLASKINLIKALSKLRISNRRKQRIGKKGKQPSSFLERLKNFEVADTRGAKGKRGRKGEGTSEREGELEGGRS